MYPDLSAAQKEKIHSPEKLTGYMEIINKLGFGVLVVGAGALVCNSPYSQPATQPTHISSSSSSSDPPHDSCALPSHRPPSPPPPNPPINHSPETADGQFYLREE
ncbi:Protein of unknown function [Pyronema omphalodes CBS 100304]|uniref:Uncharacterized protein n=1 Tax=Pyronema omphalodes (strain CBS 100304) TaxID=1076935 RepID=U4L636_PYROM|nr:Protein of unknown function [Pyronema omphalodes CBS 100304]